MDKQKYVSRLKDSLTRADNKQISNIVLSIAVLVLAFGYVTSDKSEKTIVVPATLDKPFSVQGKEVSPEYLEQMADYFSSMYLTYHRKNAKYRFDMILKFSDPASYGEMKARLDAEEDRIVRNDLSSVFFPMSIKTTKSSVYITGEQVTYIGTREITRNEKVFKWDFLYNGKALSIIGFNEVTRSSTGEYSVTAQKNDLMVDPGTAKGDSAHDGELAAPAASEQSSSSQGVNTRE